MKTLLSSAPAFTQHKLKINLSLLAFILSTAFFIIQHYLDFSWDFVTYIHNANYYFHNGSFYTLMLQPLPSLLLGIFLYLGILGEYLYIIFISYLFFYSSMHLANSLKVNKDLFYIFNLTPYALYYGLKNGTELLTLSLLMLFLSNQISEKPSGHFLALSFLARYTSLYYLPILFITKNIKNIIKGLIYLTIITLPWFIYNKITFGNYFASLADSFALNIRFRSEYIKSSINPLSLLLVASTLLPFLIIYIIDTIKHIKKIKLKLPSRQTLMLLLFFSLTMLSFYNTPIKDSRYLFNLVPIFSFLSLITLEKLKQRHPALNIKKILTLFLALSLLIVFTITLLQITDDKAKITKISAFIKDSALSDCTLRSNIWPLLNYLKVHSDFHPRLEALNNSIQKGEILIFYYKTSDPEYAPENVSKNKFAKSLPIIYEDKDFIILGNTNCTKRQEKIISKYMKGLNELIMARYSYDFGEDWCRVLFSPDIEKDSTLSRLCKKINL